MNRLREAAEAAPADDLASFASFAASPEGREAKALAVAHIQQRDGISEEEAGKVFDRTTAELASILSKRTH
jgi:hypothetical protein